MERISRLVLVLLAVCSGIFPVLFPEELKQHALPFVAVAFGLAVGAISWQRRVDSREAINAKRLSHKLQLQESRSATLAWLIKILTDPILLLEQDHAWTPAETKKAVEVLSAAMTQTLKAVSKDISVYLHDKPDTSINTNLMIAHKLSACSPDLLKRLSPAAKFLGYGRELSGPGYSHALELILWGKEEADIPKLILPVEFPHEEAGKRRLLPGGPAAFALDRDRFIPDTSKIEEFIATDTDGIGCDLDPDVLLKLREYFRSKQFKSFASLVLRDPANEKPIGILNIQSDEPQRFRPNDADTETVIKTLEHYRFALQYLLNGQRKLLGITCY